MHLAQVARLLDSALNGMLSMTDSMGEHRKIEKQTDFHPVWYKCNQAEFPLAWLEHPPIHQKVAGSIPVRAHAGGN